MTLQRLLLSCSCVAFLAACGGTIGPGEEDGPLLRTSEAAQEAEPPVESDGWPMQGTQLHGSGLSSASFNGAWLNGLPIQNLHLEKGELVGSVTYPLSGSTQSLNACLTVTMGDTRSCGFTSMGVGICTPDASVTLGGGACDLGTCTGDPVMRVCEGTAPCEHSSPTWLVSGNDACGSPCPTVQFTCPASGVYNVLAGPFVTGMPWSMTLVTDNGQPPGKLTVRGTAMKNALLETIVDGAPVMVRIEDVVSAAEVVGPSGNFWDSTGATFLYRLKLPNAVDVCQPNDTNPNWRWAVPTSGVFDPASGARSDNDPSRFTFGCDSAVIAKCYRWGYKPWLPTQEAANPEMMKKLHAACTRMARADYCGNGTSYTMNGTPIHPWDELPASIRPLPEDTPTPLFEAGWQHSGAVCLSRTRWKQLKPLPADCPLVAPGWLVEGGAGVQCPPGQRWNELRQPCATVCNSAEEAKAYDSTLRLFNESEYNVLP
jgi:ADYC domain